MPLDPAHGGADKKIWACCHGPARCNPRPRRRQILIRSRRRPLPTRALIRVRLPWRLAPRRRQSNPLRNRRRRHSGFGAERRRWLAGGHPAAPPPHRQPPDPPPGNLRARSRPSLLSAPRAGCCGVVPRNGRRRNRGSRAPLGKRYPPRRSHRPRVPPASRHPLRRRCVRSSGARSATMAIATTGVATAAAIPMRPATPGRAVHVPAARRPGTPLPQAPEPAAADSEQELIGAPQGATPHG